MAECFVHLSMIDLSVSSLPENISLVSTSQDLSPRQSRKRKMTHWHLQNQLFSNLVADVTSQMRIKEALSM